MMREAARSPSLRRIAAWFDPRRRQAGTWAFILNRVTAIGLTIFLFIHLFTLRKLAQGPEVYDAYVEVAKTPMFLVGELVVIVGVLIHGLNGLRVALNSFGIAIPYQKQLFYVLMALAVIGSVIFALRMFART